MCTKYNLNINLKPTNTVHYRKNRGSYKPYYTEMSWLLEESYD